MKIAVLFDNLGPYHRARLLAATKVAEVLAVEFGASSADYAWAADHDLRFNHACVNPDGPAGLLARTVFRGRLEMILSDFQPDAVAIPGWSTRGAFMAARWCVRHKVPAVVMSDSTAWDEPRKGWLEAVKASYLRSFSAAFVAGSPHRDYLGQLGFPVSQVVLGYDVVDNDYFEARAAEARAEVDGTRRRLALPDRYLLASARFVAKKNFPVLIAAYAQYRKTAAHPRDLVLLGDGELRPVIEDLVRTHGLESFVHLPGFRQYDDLPCYYALADAFVHASTTEQWGLVVNEAMACSLPVIISDRCGCARDLVNQGVSGWTFDPFNPGELAARLGEFDAIDHSARAAMGEASRQTIAAWGPDRFASGLVEASSMAVKTGPRRAGILDRLVLAALAAR